MALLTVTDLTKDFGGLRAVSRFSVDVEPGEILGLIGPNGAGKTTVFNLVTGFLRPTSGSILLEGARIVGLRPHAVTRRGIARTFQKVRLADQLTVYENVAAGLRLNGWRRGVKLDEQVEKSLRRAALWDEVKDRLNSLGTGLSGGQQQRLCIARAIAVEPEILLADEPASALDPVATERIEELLLDLKRDYTILLVTHNIQQAARVADRTAFFLLGDLIEYGSTNDLFTNPKDSRTEAFISGRFG